VDDRRLRLPREDSVSGPKNQMHEDKEGGYREEEKECWKGHLKTFGLDNRMKGSSLNRVCRHEKKEGKL